MARVTVEDCILLVPNRFELVMIAAQRAREISGGAPITVERDRDKNPVVALREIAESTVSLEELRNSMVSGLQQHVEQDEPEEDDLEMLMRRQLEQAAASSEAEESGILTANDMADEDGMDDLDEAGTEELAEPGALEPTAEEATEEPALDEAGRDSDADAAGRTEAT